MQTVFKVTNFLHCGTPSLISLVVSVDVKHHVYLLTSCEHLNNNENRFCHENTFNMIKSYFHMNSITMQHRYLLFLCQKEIIWGAWIAQWLSRATDSLSKYSRFKSWQEQRENFLLQGQLSALTLTSVYIPLLCCPLFSTVACKRSWSIF